MREYFKKKIKSLFVCTYLYFDVFVRYVFLSYSSSPKVPKSLYAEFNFNILHLIKIMLDFFLFLK